MPAAMLLQDIEGDSDDDIPELEEQVGGDDSAEVSSGSASGTGAAGIIVLTFCLEKDTHPQRGGCGGGNSGNYYAEIRLMHTKNTHP